MSSGDPAIRDISDTARWAAMYRALESERPDAVFKDPLARRLAGEQGHRAFESFPSTSRHSWAWVTRTWAFDQLIAAEIAQGADLVLNLAAGLDARPYRMDVPASLKWVEVDLPDLMAYKESVLAGERPRCALERIPMDLTDVEARHRLFEWLGRDSKRALVLTEGLLIYLTEDEVGALARDLAAPGFRRWVLDLVSPGLLVRLQKQIGVRLNQAGAPLKFGPEDGPEFFVKHGWKPVDVRTMLKMGAQLKRLPLFLRLVARLPDPKGPPGKRPWGGVCLLERT